MAFIEFKDVELVGMAAGVPSFIANNLHPLPDDDISSDYAPEDFVKNTGVLERRITYTQTTSDLCYHAAERLLSDLGWKKEEVDALIFVSQTRDFATPATSGILQNRLGLGTGTYCIDLTLGCSGWVYGLSNIAALVSSGGIRKALLLVGDAKRPFLDMDLTVAILVNPIAKEIEPVRDVRPILEHAEKNWILVAALLINLALFLSLDF